MSGCFLGVSMMRLGIENTDGGSAGLVCVLVLGGGGGGFRAPKTRRVVWKRGSRDRRDVLTQRSSLRLGCRAARTEKLWILLTLMPHSSK